MSVATQRTITPVFVACSISIRRACESLRAPCSSFGYVTTLPTKDAPDIELMRALL